MQIIVTESFQESSARVAEYFIALLQRKPTARLGLATGGSVEGVYAHLVAACCKGEVDFSQASSVNLDEYVGLGAEQPQSYRYYMNQRLFNHINIDKNNTYVPNGTAPVERELARFREQLHGLKPQDGHSAHLRVDLQLLGVGVSGHIGFNEPGPSLIAEAHVEDLIESTIEANSRYFNSRAEVPRQALTQGIGDILKARSLVLIASGPAKAEALGQLLNHSEVSTWCPVTLLKLHPDVRVVCERELAEAAGYRG